MNKKTKWKIKQIIVGIESDITKEIRLESIQDF